MSDDNHLCVCQVRHIKAVTCLESKDFSITEHFQSSMNAEYLSENCANFQRIKIKIRKEGIAIRDERKRGDVQQWLVKLQHNHG